MDLKDVQRLSVSCVVLGALALAWLFLLFLDDHGHFSWSWPTAALRAMRLTTWMWAGATFLLVVLTTLALIVFGVPAGADMARQSLRQVQCQDCKAVFFVPDRGQRPLTHPCPNCKALGVYDGTSPPVGTAPKAKPPAKIVELGLTCRTCHHRFAATDTGIRPMRITCPKCKAVGELL